MPTVAVLGTTAALLHIWNHALMKGLMFFAAGSVLHGTGTKDMEKLGGLMKRMPWTASAMIVGAVAIAALPPLNGFVSKWLMYVSLLKCGLATHDSLSLTALLAIGLLALIGGLAATAFIRLLGIVLLGSPRSEAVQHAHESSLWMLAPMQVLIFLCLIMALAPQMAAGLTVTVLDQILGRDASHTLLELESSETPLYIVGNANAWIVIAVGAVALVLLGLLRKRVWAEGPTWGCGYVKPTARMQYTGRSLAEMIAEHVLPRFLRPHTTRQVPRGLFPAKGDFGAECPDPFSEKIYEPFFRRWAERFSRLRVLQQGKVHVYLVYILLMVVLSLAWVSVYRWWGTS
jgi:NADH:ubiquinone oxidoreductase subunit 5 (subunit L)/multisubunit Na+/H+ antiporter MnhA subunit